MRRQTPIGRPCKTVRIDPLAKSIDIGIFRHSGRQLKVLVFEDKFRLRHGGSLLNGS